MQSIPLIREAVCFVLKKLKLTQALPQSYKLLYMELYEMLIGLNVLDDSKYEEYRENMKPILSSYEGGFGYDFKISEVLLTKTTNEINRVFTIYFPDIEKMEAFFSNPEYLKIKEQYFEGSVESTTIISTYTKNI